MHALICFRLWIASIIVLHVPQSPQIVILVPFYVRRQLLRCCYSCVVDQKEFCVAVEWHWQCLPTCQPNFNQCLSSFPSHRSPPRWVPTSTYRSFTARSRPMLCASCSACGAGSIVNCRQSTVHPARLAQTRPGGWDSEQSRVSLCHFSLNHFTI